jgi:hypothetical protein
VRPLEPANPKWFSVDGESVRDFAPDASEQVVVQLVVPPASPPGSYSFRLDVVSEVDSEEDFTEGPSIAFDVLATPPPKKKRLFLWPSWSERRGGKGNRTKTRSAASSASDD